MIATQVPALDYHPDFVAAGEAAALITSIDAADWSDELRRRVQHYGFRYDYKAKRVGDDMRAAPLPGWALHLCKRLVAAGVFTREPDQVIVNEYEPGQGIAPHLDCVPCFGGTIASLSLLSPCIMTFSDLGSPARVDLDLAPGSLLAMSGPARYHWRHGIAARMHDPLGDALRKRERRVSVTFRTVKLDHVAVPL